MDPAAALANRVLDGETWAQERLAAHAGRTFMIAVGPLATAMRIDASGHVATVPLGGEPADVALRISALALPAFLVNPTRWDELITVSGDPALAQTLRDVAQTMPWFVERIFAQVLGPVVGQRVADAGRQLLGFPGQAAGRLGESMASYARDEAALAAHARAFREFKEGSDALAERVETLAAGIDALAARLPPG